MANRFSVEAVFSAIDKLSAPVTRMENRVRKFARNSTASLKQLDRTTGKLGGTFSAALGAAGVAGGVAALGMAMTSVVTSAVGFEQALVNAAAKFPEGIKKGTKEFKALEEAARATGATTEFTAGESAEALNFMAMAGFNAEQSIASLPLVVDLATASNIDLARATDIASDTLGAFGLATKDPIKLTENLTRVNDVLAKTVTTANTDMEMLFETIKEGGPVATAAGASMETFAALAGKLANAGVKGSVAGTTLKNVFVRLTKPVGDAADMLDRMGVKTKDMATGEARDVIDIFGDLTKGLDDLGSADRLAAIETVFGKIPLAGVNVLLNEGADSLRSYRAELVNSKGASKSMATTMRDTLGVSFKVAMSALDGLGLTIFENFGPAIRSGVEKVTSFVSAVDNFLKKNKETIPVILEMAAGVSKVVALFVALKIATIAWSLAMAVTPFGLVVAGLTALIAITPLLIRNWDKVTAVFKTAWAFWKNVFIKGLDAIIAKALMIVDVFKKVAKYTPAGLAFAGAKKALNFFGVGGDDETATADGAPQVVSPQERIAKTIEERSTTSNATLTINDKSGRGELEDNTGPGINLALAASGGF